MVVVERELDLRRSRPAGHRQGRHPDEQVEVGRRAGRADLAQVDARVGHAVAQKRALVSLAASDQTYSPCSVRLRATRPVLTAIGARLSQSVEAPSTVIGWALARYVVRGEEADQQRADERGQAAAEGTSSNLSRFAPPTAHYPLSPGPHDRVPAGHCFKPGALEQ